MRLRMPGWSRPPRFRTIPGIAYRLALVAAGEADVAITLNAPTSWDVAGGHALFDGSALQRAHRDVHAGSHQVALTWDTYAEQYGRVRLGLEPNDPFV